MYSYLVVNVSKTFLVELQNYIGTGEYNAMIARASFDFCVERKETKFLDILILGHVKGSYRSITTQ